MPGWLLATVGSAALLMAVSAASSAPWDSLTIDLRHRWVAATATRAPTEPGNGTPIVGMNVFLEQEVEPAKRQRSLELLQAAGVSWIRQELPWEQIEPLAKGQTVDPNFGGSTWTKFDDIVDRASALGMKVMLRLDTSPRWALPADSTDGLGPPVSLTDYFDFVGQVAARYRGRVAAYQIWNEPNLTSEWGHRPPDPRSNPHREPGRAQRARVSAAAVRRWCPRHLRRPCGPGIWPARRA